MSASPRRTGRRVAVAIYYALVAAVSLAGAAQITWQVLFGPAPAGPYASCHEGLRALFDAVVRARDDAAKTDQGEDAALARFRTALEPAWTFRDDIASRCGASPRDKGALDAIERLRYAEEHAVRREAGELAPLRRRVQAIVDRDLTGRAGTPPADPARPVEEPTAPETKLR